MPLRDIEVIPPPLTLPPPAATDDDEEELRVAAAVAVAVAASATTAAAVNLRFHNLFKPVRNKKNYLRKEHYKCRLNIHTY